MNIFAVNSSPRTGVASKTELMLDHLTAGMREAGAQVEVVNLREKTIRSCIGCFTCWSKTPGRCIHQDDMSRELFPKWLAADLVVYATPLYYHTQNGLMATFRERTLPAIHPFIDHDGNGKSYHELRRRPFSVAWLSVCGFSDESEFDALSYYLNRTRHKDIRLVAEIYRPASEGMSRPEHEKVAKEILDATRQAGRELVDSLAVSPETMARIRQPLTDPESYAQMANIFWKTCIDEGVSPREFQEKDLVPRPDSLENFMTFLRFHLNADAVRDETAILQFHFSGEVTESCHFVIRKNQVEAKSGSDPAPDLVIDTPFGTWMDIMTRKADGQQMFMEGKYKVQGDIELMIRLFQKEDPSSERERA
jgi:hypothetical protein